MSDDMQNILAIMNEEHKGWFTRSTFWIQLSLKFKDVSDVNQHFHELKQSQKIIGSKNGSCEPGRIKKRAAHSENFLGGLVCTRNLAFRLQ